MKVEMYKINDISAASYIELPELYKNNKSIINIENNDHLCFLWSILAKLYPAIKNKYKTYNYTPYINTFNLDGISLPMYISNVPKFENQNKLCINVFELNENNVIEPKYINKNYTKPQIDLLLYKNHYCLITKLHTLISNNSHTKYICRRCLNTFSTQLVLNTHINMCQNNEACKIIFPKDDQLNFNQNFMKIGIPIRVYYDFECFNIKKNLVQIEIQKFYLFIILVQ